MDCRAISRLSFVLILATVFAYATTARAGDSTDNATQPGKSLAQAEADRTTNYSKFLQILKNLNQEKEQLSAKQKWNLRYLNAWQAVIAGNYAKATSILDKIIHRSNDSVLEVRASGLKINILSRQKHYVKAYELANKLISDLPTITNNQARIWALNQIIQMLSFAGQYGQLQEYVRLLKSESVTGGAQCQIESYVLNALFMANQLSSTSRRLKAAIDLCLSDKEMIYANTLQLDKADLLITEGHAKRAIGYLHRIAPSILKVKYQSHIVSLHSTLARAYLSQKNYSNAKKEALAAIAINSDNGSTLELEDPYRVLYKTEKQAGRSAAALAYYEKYVKLDKASMNDAKARALAYQMVNQEVRAKKLKLEALTKQNQILKLRQTLGRKAAETSHLYIAMLIIAIILIGIWLYRIKHSQIRFRRMARHDDLTETFNRQHFIDEAKRVLLRLSKDKAKACLIIIDLDHFKRINDLHGHIAGDEVLKHAVEVSRSELRSSDVLGRLGGEEFGILMPACSSAQGVEIGERIRHALASTPKQLNAEDSVTVYASIGLACTSTSGYELVQLLIDADAALYTAKRRGRNRLIVGTGKDTRPGAQGTAKASGPVHE